MQRLSNRGPEMFGKALDPRGEEGTCGGLPAPVSGLKKPKVPQRSHTDPLQIRTPGGDHGDKTRGRPGQPVEWEVRNDETVPGRALARLNQAGTRRAPRGRAPAKILVEFNVWASSGTVLY